MKLCIPSVKNSKLQIIQILQEMDLGKITYSLDNRAHFYTIYINVQKWNFNNKIVKQVYNKLSNNEEINYVYQFPWFWKIRQMEN